MCILFIIKVFRNIQGDLNSTHLYYRAFILMRTYFCIQNLKLKLPSTAPKFVDVQKEVAALIKDKILIGHSISTDLKVSVN